MGHRRAPWQGKSAQKTAKNKVVIQFERLKANIRGQGGTPIPAHQRQFGFVKARYKGLMKNDNQLAMLFTLANLSRVGQLIRAQERST